MPYRAFEDSTGKEWQVWDVVPRMTERRRAEADRRVDITPITHSDRRRGERRLHSTHRAVLRGTYAQGWLCFDNGEAKKRLSPIPGDWTVCDDETLEAYLRVADEVKLPRVVADYGTPDSFQAAG